MRVSRDLQKCVSIEQKKQLIHRKDSTKYTRLARLNDIDHLPQQGSGHEDEHVKINQSSGWIITPVTLLLQVLRPL